MKTNFIKKSLVLYLIIFVISLSIGIFFRSYPLRTFVQNDSSEKATLIVIARLKSQVSQQIRQQHPNLSAAETNKLKQEMFAKLMKKEGERVRAAIDKVTTNIDGNSTHLQKYPYLLAADSFHFYQLTENLIETGAISDVTQGSKYLNKLMLAPIGHLEPITLHPHVGAGIFGMLKLFDPTIELTHALSLTPLILTGLSLIFFILICALMNASKVSTFVASIFYICSPIFIKRSAYGWYDNDPYNTLFPLMILTLFFWGMRHSNNMGKLILAAVMTSLAIFLYSLFWQGWMLVFLVILVSGGLLLGVKKFRPDTNLSYKNLLAFFGSIGLLSFALISFKFGINEFFLVFEEGFKALKNFLTPQLSVWPDLYISVGELHKASLSEIIVLTGGYTFFAIGLFGLIGLWINLFQSKNRYDAAHTLTISVFFAFALWITLGAQRFALLCLIPFSLMFLVGLDTLRSVAISIISKSNKSLVPQIIVSGLSICLILLPMLSIQKSIPSLLNPIYNDTWHTALTKIHTDTPPNSIVNTWWPPGHFIKATAKRRVTFDGATINYPQAYWITRIYLSQSEREALGLMRMLNASANQATEYLQELGFPVSSCVAILRTITSLTKNQARVLLSTKIKKQDKITRLLELTHSKPDPSYLFIYNELIEKNIQMAFIGKWNFEKIEEINANPELLEKVPDASSKEYIQFLWQLAGGPFKYNAPLTEIKRKANMVLFDGNIQVNLDNKQCVINSPKFGKGTPQSIFYVENDQVIEQKFQNANLSFSTILYKDGTKYNIVLLDQYLANSLIMRLYYFGDAGLKHMKTFTEAADLTRRTDIRVFEINWESFQRETQ